MTPIMKKSSSLIFLCLFVMLFSSPVKSFDGEQFKLVNRGFNRTQEELQKMQQEELERKRPPKYNYAYYDRDHSFKESAGHIAAIYGITWVVYPLSQWEVFKEKGSLKKYRRNFGELVFDKDEPFWNQLVHPISGSQLFLYYRANGYSRMDSFLMSTISSSLFELTVEVYTEPASVQDLYITPVFGSILGLGLEKASLYLLNTGNAFGRFWGHVINPATLFWFYEGRVRLTPTTDFQEAGSLTLSVEF